jgi:hypothetical protein
MVARDVSYVAGIIWLWNRAGGQPDCGFVVGSMLQPTNQPIPDQVSVRGQSGPSPNDCFSDLTWQRFSILYDMLRRWNGT